MRRREFVALEGGMASFSLTARAQQGHPCVTGNTLLTR